MAAWTYVLTMYNLGSRLGVGGGWLDLRPGRCNSRENPDTYRLGGCIERSGHSGEETNLFPLFEIRP